jgi:hypothetical protein
MKTSNKKNLNIENTCKIHSVTAVPDISIAKAKKKPCGPPLLKLTTMVNRMATLLWLCLRII